MSRQRCHRCFRRGATCVCDRVPAVANRTEVRILQHPREARHPFGSAALLRASLANLTVDVGVAHPRPESLDGLALLWPAAASTPLAEPPRTVVVLDGTWGHARAIRNACGWLAELPTIDVSGAPGAYRSRREPNDGGLATVEAVARALRRLEPELEGCEALAGVFEGREQAWSRATFFDARRRRERTRRPPQHRALADYRRALVGFRSGPHFAVRRVDDRRGVWVGRREKDGTIVATDPIDAWLEDASAFWAWRAAPFARLVAGLPARDLKTLHRQRGGAAGPLHRSGLSLADGLDLTAALLESIARAEVASLRRR